MATCFSDAKGIDIVTVRANSLNCEYGTRLNVYMGRLKVIKGRIEQIVTFHVEKKFKFREYQSSNFSGRAIFEIGYETEVWRGLFGTKYSE
jgi:hypothetical protein